MQSCLFKLSVKNQSNHEWGGHSWPAPNIQFKCVTAITDYRLPITDYQFS